MHAGLEQNRRAYRFGFLKWYLNMHSMYTKEEVEAEKGVESFVPACQKQEKGTKAPSAIDIR